jgi:hypothetical protein
MEEAPGVVSVMMRDTMGGGAYRGLRQVGLEGQRKFGRTERRHGPGRERSRRRLG